jgi:hypothetical protein
MFDDTNVTHGAVLAQIYRMVCVLQVLFFKKKKRRRRIWCICVRILRNFEQLLDLFHFFLCIFNCGIFIPNEITRSNNVCSLSTVFLQFLCHFSFDVCTKLTETTGCRGTGALEELNTFFMAAPKLWSCGKGSLKSLL